jgi:shikimate kinase
MDLLFVVGPPAVGKMTVGKEIADRTGLRLFHNHMMIEPVLHFFDYEDPAFGRLVEEFRIRIFEEVAASDLSPVGSSTTSPTTVPPATSGPPRRRRTR